MPKKGDNDQKEPSHRVQFRLKSNLYKFTVERANAVFGGDLTEYFKYIVAKDRETCPNDAAMWLEQLRSVKQDLLKQIGMIDDQESALKQQISNGKRG